MYRVTRKQNVRNAEITNDFLERFIEQYDDKDLFERVQNKLMELLYASKGLKRYEEQSSFAHVKEGVDKMFSVMKNNYPITAAPVSEEERVIFYKKLAKGFEMIGESLREGFEQGKIDRSDLFSCMETIGTGGYSCAGRWRQVLEEMYRASLSQTSDKDAIHQGNPLQQKLELDYEKACIVEVNKGSEEFTFKYYGQVNQIEKLHFTSFFRRVVNQKKNLQLPVTMDEDSYMLRFTDQITGNIEHYLRDTSIDANIVKRFEDLLQQRLNQDADFYERVLQYWRGVYHQNDCYHKQIELTDFYAEHVFKGYSKAMRKSALRTMIADKDFVHLEVEEIDIQKLLSALFPQNKIRKDDSVERKVIQDLEEIAEDYVKGFDKPLNLSSAMHLRNIQGDTLLMLGVQNNSLGLCRYLLTEGNEVNDANIHGETPLIQAAKLGNVKMGELLLSFGAQINEKSFEKTTAFYCAITRKKMAFAQLLYRHGADINIVDRNGLSPLFISILGNSSEIAKWLVDKGANVNEVTKHGESPIYAALVTKQFDIAKLLLDKGANPHHRTREGTSAYLKAVADGHTEFVQRMITRKEHLDETDKVKNSALMLAIKNQHRELAILLLEKGANVNLQNKSGNTAMHLAILNDDFHLVKHLMKKGAQLDLQDRHGESAFFLAIRYNRNLIVQYMVKKQDVLKQINPSGKNALHWSVLSGSTDVLKTLMRYMNNVNDLDQEQKTPLWYAVLSKNVIMTRILLPKKPNILSSDSYGNTPFSWAAKYNQTEILDLLISSESIFNRKDAIGETPLIIMVKKGDIQRVQTMIEKGAKVNYQDSEGGTPLMWAVKEENFNMVKLLIEKGADINLVDNEGNSARHFASNADDARIGDYLTQVQKELICKKMQPKQNKKEGNKWFGFK